MLNPLDILGRLGDYVRDKPYWAKIEPLFTLVSLFLMTAVLAYQYIDWRYNVSPPLPLYVRSYIFKQIAVIFAAIGLAGFLLARVRGAPEGETLASKVRKHARGVLRPALIVTAVLALAVPALVYLTPARVSHIRVKFLDEPSFNKYALTYLIYELNRMQKSWYFEVDFDVFNEGVLSSSERARCDGAPNRTLCLAQLLSKDGPLVGITAEQAGEDHFFQNQGRVSVISTFGWERYAPPSTYEFVVYSLLVQSILIHLNSHGGGLPAGAFQESRTAVGEMFQFSPRRHEMKAAILAPHLTPKGEELLLNSFGVEYMTTCQRLLTLEWLQSERVLKNMDKSFGVKL